MTLESSLYACFDRILEGEPWVRSYFGDWKRNEVDQMIELYRDRNGSPILVWSTALSNNLKDLSYPTLVRYKTHWNPGVREGSWYTVSDGREFVLPEFPDRDSEDAFRRDMFHQKVTKTLFHPDGLYGFVEENAAGIFIRYSDICDSPAKDVTDGRILYEREFHHLNIHQLLESLRGFADSSDAGRQYFESTLRCKLLP